MLRPIPLKNNWNAKALMSNEKGTSRYVSNQESNSNSLLLQDPAILQVGPRIKASQCVSPFITHYLEQQSQISDFNTLLQLTKIGSADPSFRHPWQMGFLNYAPPIPASSFVSLINLPTGETSGQSGAVKISPSHKKGEYCSNDRAGIKRTRVVKNQNSKGNKNRASAGGKGGFDECSSSNTHPNRNEEGGKPVNSKEKSGARSRKASEKSEGGKGEGSVYSPGPGGDGCGEKKKDFYKIPADPSGGGEIVLRQEGKGHLNIRVIYSREYMLQCAGSPFSCLPPLAMPYVALHLTEIMRKIPGKFEGKVYKSFCEKIKKH